MKHVRPALLVLLTAATASAATLDDATRERGYRLSNDLVAGKAEAADEVMNLADDQPDTVVYFLAMWCEGLAKAKRYDVIYKLADVVTRQRPYAWPEAADAQRFRTAALISEGKFDDALTEAKRNYDLCILARTDDAVGLISLAMRGRDPKAEPVIKTLAAEQTPDRQPARSLASDLLPATQPAGPSTRHAGGVLGTIPSDPKPFAEALAGDIGNNDFENWFGHGNLLLLAGKPGDAKAWFRKIAEADGMSTQQLTRAIEGVARCIRAEDGNPARANAFVAELQAGKK